MATTGPELIAEARPESWLVSPAPHIRARESRAHIAFRRRSLRVWRPRDPRVCLDQQEIPEYFGLRLTNSKSFYFWSVVMQTIQSSIVRGVIGLLVVTYVFVVAS